ncbi:MAG TPA: SDR family oxidoreductase [Lacipirellulaceae bacterium]|jgi:pteridine reductase|nr:SDR family oxidoreductase [Lacipirellulaceae bacterium]
MSKMNDNPADHPVALVTGGAIRVGAAIVRELAARGYHVAIHANSSLNHAQELANELTGAGHTAAAFGADLRDEDATRAMVDRVRRHFGRLDALVNSASAWSPTPLADVMADDVRRFFEVNTLSTFICCQHAGQIMIEQPQGGAIVNIGDWAVERPYRNFSAYFASKGAIPTLTRTFAVELAPKVRVNAVRPGPVLLPESVSEADRRRAIAGTLLGRAGRPENIAHAVAALLENDFITGVCLPVDGGRTLGETS